MDSPSSYEPLKPNSITFDSNPVYINSGEVLQDELRETVLLQSTELSSDYEPLDITSKGLKFQ